VHVCADLEQARLPWRVPSTTPRSGARPQPCRRSSASCGQALTR